MDTREKIARWLREKAYARDDWDQIPDMWRAGWRNKADEVLSLIGPYAECTARKADVSETRDALHVMKKAMQERDAYKKVVDGMENWIDFPRVAPVGYQECVFDAKVKLGDLRDKHLPPATEPVEERHADHQSGPSYTAAGLPREDDSKWPMDAANQGIVKPEPKPLPPVPENIGPSSTFEECEDATNFCLQLERDRRNSMKRRDG